MKSLLDKRLRAAGTPWRRTAVTVVAVLSALLGIVAVLLWAWSERASTHIGWPVRSASAPLSPTGSREVTVSRGCVRFYAEARDEPDLYGYGSDLANTTFRKRVQTPPVDLRTHLMQGKDAEFVWAGFGFADGRRYSLRFSCVQFPLWFLAALAAVAPACWVRRARGQWRREKRRLANLCTECGYDLRGGNKVCPECGAAQKHAGNWDTTLQL